MNSVYNYMGNNLNKGVDWLYEKINFKHCQVKEFNIHKKALTASIDMPYFVCFL